ncbi:MAG TPA: hypothetical protein VNG31_09920, partial [Candidatus Baltobacteraceae bacterium]|nr:hypothetical protein [Candidatus Baltobacteraceae bacterium]
MKIRAIASCWMIAALVGCGGSPQPAGWQPVPGSPNVWTTGRGGAAQRYSYEKKPFPGTLQDLASQQAINVVLRNRGAKLERSDVFTPCPGMAAIAYFHLGKDRNLDQGFAVQGDNAVIVTYVRP